MKKIFSILILILLLSNGCSGGEKVPVQKTSNGEMLEEKNENQSDINKRDFKFEYASFLDDLYKDIPDKEDCSFALIDLDKDGIDELLVVKGETDLSVYTFDSEVTEVGQYNFFTGTTKFFVSQNTKYSGVFCFSVEGGFEWYRHIDIKDDQLIIEDLWNEDYSGISEILGDKRDRILELSSDKALIQESKKVYKNNQILLLEYVTSSNYSNLLHQ